ncbi:hypothetical protein E2562_028614 [Oryza meyeriana var. granulata]|uniref:Endonuclease/exonuclease/phosphatase domain-containing protein n=1 Tax=Oryza meyeriana var. granulata TaxID=110450 RepID=A0A6G1D922_9ORYZ|nr:hypothetical protein E2562_028614 [Oryza meyeriana var. granulata]
MSSADKIKFMTYNVWSCEHVAVYRRIQAISALIVRHEPHVIFLQLIVLQEVTEYISSIFAEEHWWTKSRPPGLLSAWVYKPVSSEHCGGSAGHLFGSQRHRVCAATCRLEGPTPKDVGSKNRRTSAGLFLEHFDEDWNENVVLGGDLSWDDDLDGSLQLGSGWVDAWKELRGDDGGWTYDAVANPMLRGWRRPERKRPDRFVCKLWDFRLDSIEMVGVEPIPGVTHCDDKGNVLPVLPAHHFGLLLTIAPK